MTIIMEQPAGTPTIEAFKSKCSIIGKKLLESAGSFAKLSKHNLGIQDIATTLFWNTTILEVLQEVDISPQQACKTFIESILSDRNKYKPAGSIQDIFDVARKESVNAKASKIRAGDIMMAILESPTASGKALREALSAGKEKGVSFLTQLRIVIDQVEKPWTA